MDQVTKTFLERQAQRQDAVLNGLLRQLEQAEEKVAKIYEAITEINADIAVRRETVAGLRALLVENEEANK